MFASSVTFSQRHVFAPMMKEPLQAQSTHLLELFLGSAAHPYLLNRTYNLILNWIKDDIVEVESERG